MIMRTWLLMIGVVIVLSVPLPVSVFAYGGGGGGGGDGDGGISSGGMGFFEPNSEGGMDIAGGTIDINNLPEHQLTPQEILEIQSNMANLEAGFWNVGTPIVEGLAFGGKVAGWILAFTPAGVPVKIALASARGAADGYAASAEKGDGNEAGQAGFSGVMAGVTEGATSNLHPVVGIVIGEVVGQATTNGAQNSAPAPNIGDSTMEQSKVTHNPYTGQELTVPVYK